MSSAHLQVILLFLQSFHIIDDELKLDEIEVMKEDSCSTTFILI
jgi:hypothetical protein